MAAMLSGVVWVAQGLFDLILADPDEGNWLDVLFIVSVFLALVGLVGFHALQKGNYGRIGQAGFYTVIVSSVAQILALVVLLAGSEALVWLLSIGSLGVLVGFALYGAATLQARVLPRWCGVAFIIALPITILWESMEEISGLGLFGWRRVTYCGRRGSQQPSSSPGA
jgi:hypothetical protein